MERQEDCAICKMTGCLTADGWYSDATLDRDEEGYYMAGHGEYLSDAADVPAGWVCSKRCRSQAMYHSVKGFEREALNKVLDACIVLSNYGVEASKVIAAHTDDEIPEGLIQGALEFLDIAAEAAWTNRETREAQLEGVIRQARSDLDVAAFFASIPASCAMTSDIPGLWHESEVRISARSAASMGRIALDLKAAGDE